MEGNDITFQNHIHHYQYVQALMPRGSPAKRLLLLLEALGEEVQQPVVKGVAPEPGAPGCCLHLHLQACVSANNE